MLREMCKARYFTQSLVDANNMLSGVWVETFMIVAFRRLSDKYTKSVFL